MLSNYFVLNPLLQDSTVLYAHYPIRKHVSDNSCGHRSELAGDKHSTKLVS